MVSEKFMVNSDAGRMAAAQYAADSYAVDAGLDINAPLYQDAIDLSNPEQQPYINIIVAKTSESSNPVYLEVADAYQSAKVYDATIDRFNGAAIPAFDRE